MSTRTFSPRSLAKVERKEPVSPGPLLVTRGALDDNVLPAMQEKFVKTYRAAGGQCDYHLLENCEHQWVANLGPRTDLAREMVKCFIARHVLTT